MSIDVSVITCVYNTRPVVAQCLEALRAFDPGGNVSMEIVLVDNHSPDDTARQYVKDLVRADPRVRLYDPGQNLGCHRGWNFGYDQSVGDYVVKLDDDTVVKTHGWLGNLVDALDVYGPSLAYLAADCDARQGAATHEMERGGRRIEVVDIGIVGFSCVMFRRQDTERWGPMRCGAYRLAGGVRVQVDDGMYGGEEVYYSNLARKEGRMIGYHPCVFVHHLANEERHVDYPMWKRAYGYYGWTRKDMAEWIASGEHVDNYAMAMLVEGVQPTPNDVLLRDWAARLGELGTTRRHAEVVRLVGEASKNGVVKEACSMAYARIYMRMVGECDLGEALADDRAVDPAASTMGDPEPGQEGGSQRS